jgi:hypothetical protein
MTIADDDRVRKLACLSIDLEIHFPNICACMVISVGGGIPREGHDIRLGDVVVSTPDRQYGGVVNVDEDYVGEPNALLDANEPATLAFARLLEQDIRTELGPGGMLKHVAEMKATKPKLVTEYTYPGAEKDLLFPSEYECKRDWDGQGTCAEFDDPSKAVIRPARTNTDPKVHFGTVAACRCVVEYTMDRDLIREHTGALAVQIGAEYLMNIHPLVIIGIANYGNSHSDWKWKKYAAANAAACAKDLDRRFPLAQ